MKIENDGFDLGAQRREIEQNDLPEALKAIEAWRTNQKAPKEGIAHAVSRKRILESPECGFTGDRYRPTITRGAGNWPMVKLGEIAEYINGFPFKPTDWKTDGRKIIQIQNLTGTSAEFNYAGRVDIPAKFAVRRGDLLISWSATIGFYVWDDEEAVLNQHIFKVVPSPRVHKKYLYFLGDRVRELILGDVHGNTMQHITKGRFDNLEIPLPPLAEQERLVAELEGYRKVIEAARQIVANYKPSICIDPKWPMIKLGKVCETITKGSSPNWQGVRYVDSGGVLFVTSENVGSGEMLLSKKKCVEARFNTIEKRSILRKGDVLTNIVGASIGRTAIYDQCETANINQAVCVLRCNEAELINSYLMFLLNSDYFLAILHANKLDNARANLSLGFFENLEIPLPPIDVQRSIVAEIEAERSLVDSNRELIARFENKMQARLAEIWGE